MLKDKKIMIIHKTDEKTNNKTNIRSHLQEATAQTPPTWVSFLFVNPYLLKYLWHDIAPSSCSFSPRAEVVSYILKNLIILF